MELIGEFRTRATRENLRLISYLAHGLGQRLRLTEDSLFSIELAMEEAAVNIVSHAYLPDQPGDIVIRVEMADDVLYLTLIDWGIPFDPAAVKPFDITAPVESRIQGGMGLHLIRSLMDAVQRKPADTPDGPNVLTLVKRVERLQPDARHPSSLRELSAMRTVSEVMATTTDLDDLLALIVNKLVETIGAERGTLYLVDEERNELFSHVLLEDRDTLEEIRVPIGEGISGHVAATGDVLNIRQAYDDPRFMETFDRMTGYRTHTLLTAPLRNPHGQIVGVVQLLNKKGGPFTTRDERLLTAMAAQAAISIENARLYEQEIQQQLTDQELETARVIQESFLPQTSLQHEGWDIAASWHPMRKVAGDFYDFYRLPDGRLALIIADVSGKGVPAALFMALSRTVLRFAMSLNFAPDELMVHANQAILADQQSRMFATVFAGYLDLEWGGMRFASAGHNPPLLYRAATRRCEYLEAYGVALGVFKDASYGAETVQIAPGDILVLYTDGITEIIDENEQEFGEGRLEELVSQNAGRSARDLCRLISETAGTFASDEGIFDDETLVVVKCL